MHPVQKRTGRVQVEKQTGRDKETGVKILLQRRYEAQDRKESGREKGYEQRVSTLPGG